MIMYKATKNGQVLLTQTEVNEILAERANNQINALQEKRKTMTISALQLELALANAGYLAQIKSYVLSLPEFDPIRISYERMQKVNRLSSLIPKFMTLLNISDIEADRIFEAGSLL